VRNLKTDTPSPFSRRAKGQEIEKACYDFLVTHKIHIICCNFYSKFGEIDLIGTEKNTLIFFEIRYRNDKGYGTALESVTTAKQRRIYKTALFFNLRHPQFQHFSYRFDIIGATTYNGELVLNWQKNAFQEP